MNFNNKRVLIVGYGLSGKSAYNLLKNKGCNVVIYDDKLKNTHKNLLGYFDLAIVSPGIKNCCVAKNFIKQNNIPTLTEIELGMIFCECKNIIGITGTNGKTTVVSLLEHIISLSGKKAIACGNNGVCFSSVCEHLKENDFCILELSSFMLKEIKNLHLDVACFLNFKSDHLDFHKTEQDYFESKQSIFKFQNAKDISILNADDEKISLMTTKGEIFCFSTKTKTRGVYVENNKIVFNDANKKEVIMKTSDVPLLGNFNLANVCSCVLIALLIKLDKALISKSVKTFMPVKHRLNLIWNEDFKVFNDSKSTNVASCLASLSCFKNNVILILGGSDKGENFDELFNQKKSKTKQFVLTGAVRRKLKYYAVKNDCKNYIVIRNFKKAILFALKIAKKGDVVLFSPACASFDCFKNFEERGEFFERIVGRYFGKNKK